MQICCGNIIILCIIPLANASCGRLDHSSSFPCTFFAASTLRLRIAELFSTVCLHFWLSIYCILCLIRTCTRATTHSAARASIIRLVLPPPLPYSAEEARKGMEDGEGEKKEEGGREGTILLFLTGGKGPTHPLSPLFPLPITTSTLSKTPFGGRKYYYGGGGKKKT